MTALIALSLIFFFSDVIYRAKLEGKIFPSFLKHFSLQVAQQVMTVVDSAKRLKLVFHVNRFTLFEGIRPVFVAKSVKQRGLNFSRCTFL